MDSITSTLDVICLASQIILESGGETYRAEETVERMCKGLHIPSVDVLALPTGLIVTLSDASGVSHTRLVRVSRRSTNLARMDKCNAVSRQVASGAISVPDALEKLKEIYRPRKEKKWFWILASALSASGFAVMLGGRWIDFFIAFFCGMLLQAAQFFLAGRNVPSLLSGLISGALTALVAQTGMALFPGVQVEPIIAGTIMPLLPGLATTNGIRDTLRGDLVSGGARIVEALLCATMLGAGIGIVLSLWGGLKI